MCGNGAGMVCACYALNVGCKNKIYLECSTPEASPHDHALPLKHKLKVFHTKGVTTQVHTTVQRAREKPQRYAIAAFATLVTRPHQGIHTNIRLTPTLRLCRPISKRHERTAREHTYGRLYYHIAQVLERHGPPQAESTDADRISTLIH